LDAYYSGSRLQSASDYFCGAVGRNFFITPAGNITTCLEVCRENDKRNEIFVIGNYQDGSFSLDRERIMKLKQRTVDNIPYCSDCFAKYSCSGDCPAKVYEQSGDLLDPSNNLRCDANIAIQMHEIKTKMRGDGNERKTKL